MSDTRILQKHRKTKKNKMAEPMSQWIPEYCKNLEKPKKLKKTKWQNLCPSVWHGVSTFGFFGLSRFSQVKPKNQKKQNGRTYVPVSGMGSVLLFFLVFLVFPGKTKKTKKNKMAEPMSQCLAWGQYFWFFWFVEVFPGKTKKTKKNKMAEPMSQCLAWGQYFCFFFVFFGFPR